MVTEIKVPGVGTDEVEVTEILVRVGDKVKAGQSSVTVEGDKASVEVPSPQAGTVKKIRVSVGDKIQTSVLIMIFDSADDAASTAPAQAEEKKEAAPATASAVATAKDVDIPGIGSDEAEMTETLVRISDKVEAEQSLIVVKGDEASTEVPAPFVGTAKEIKVNAGDRVSTGSLIMASEVMGEAGATTPVTKQEAVPAAAPAPAAGVKEVNVPDIGGGEVGITEVTVRVGDKVAVEQSLTTIEDGKVSMKVPAPFTGVMRELRVNVGNKAKAGSLIMVFKAEGAASAIAPAKQEAAAPAPAVEAEASVATPAAKVGGKSEFVENDTYVHATPLIRRLAREFGVNLAKMGDTGRKGRILREDVQAYMRGAAKHAETALATTGDGIPDMLLWPRAGSSKFGEIEEMELDRIQKTPGANLNRGWVMVPHVIHFNETDIIELEAFRKQQNGEAVKRKLDVEIAPVVFIMKAVAAAPEQMLRFNSSLSEDGQHLTLKKYINIGVAVGTPNGPAVPIFKDVNKEGTIELSRELMTILKKTHGGKLTAGEMQGGCFTVFSISGLGTTHFASIVNAPEVAILGVSKSAMKPMWNGKGFVPRPMLLTSLSFDHHVIGGADGARFIVIINNMPSDIRHLVI